MSVGMHELQRTCSKPARREVTVRAVIINVLLWEPLSQSPVLLDVIEAAEKSIVGCLRLPKDAKLVPQLRGMVCDAKYHS